MIMKKLGKNTHKTKGQQSNNVSVQYFSTKSREITRKKIRAVDGKVGKKSQKIEILKKKKNVQN